MTIKKPSVSQLIDLLANYGTIKAYHADVWLEAYAIGIE